MTTKQVRDRGAFPVNTEMYNHVPAVESDFTYDPDGLGLTLDEIAAYVARYTYKPDWHFTVEPLAEPWDGNHPGFRLVLTALVPDAENPDGERFSSVGHIDAPMGMREEDLDRAIRWFVEYREIHELREWLKLDGTPVDFPPH